MSYQEFANFSTGLNELERDSKKEYIFKLPIENLGIKGGKKMGYNIGIELENKGEEYVLYFHKLDKGGNKKENGDCKNFVRFSIKDDGTVNLWGMHIENILRGKNLNGVKPSDFILNFFINYTKKIGFEKIKTGGISKPLLAKLLEKHGFKADKIDILAIPIRQKEVEKLIEEKIDTINILIDRIRNLENEIENLGENGKNTSGPSINKRGTLSLGGNKSKKLEIERTKHQLIENIKKIESEIRKLENALKKEIPIINWYGTRQVLRGGKKEFDLPDVGRDNNKFFEINRIQHTLPENSEGAIAIQTCYSFSENNDVAGTINRSVERVLEILNGKK